MSLPVTSDALVALVTGGANGIGRATVLKLAGEGTRVVVCDIDEPAGKRVVEEARSLGVEAELMTADVTDEVAVRRLISDVVERFGQLDYAHNNAGGMTGPAAPTADLPSSTWYSTIALNLTSAFLLTKYELQAMVPNRTGSIVITTSGDGIHPSPTRQAYAAAKAGVIGFVRAVAGEYGHQGIRVNAVAPGPIRTAGLEAWLNDPAHEAERQEQVIRAIPRLGEAEEIANAVSWLFSESASYVNGAVLVVDGGHLR